MPEAAGSFGKQAVSKRQTPSLPNADSDHNRSGNQIGITQAGQQLMTKHNLNTPASTDAENEISKMILQQVKNWNQGDIDSFMKPYENETPMTVNTEPPNFTAVVESQSAVTHRMIGLKRGRTRKSRFLKLAAIGSIFALAVFCTWWVLSHFKEEHQSWNELLVYIIQRLTT